MELAFLSLLGIVMGVITSISGGAGVFAVPMMMAMGIPAINTLVLNRTSDMGVLLGATTNYQKSKSIDWKLALISMTPMAIGAFLGANFSISISEEQLRYVIIGAILIGIFFLLKPFAPSDHNKIRVNYVWGVFLLFLVGAWSGALGIAGGTFGTLVFVHVFRKSFLEARSTDIAAVYPETIVSVLVLYFGSTVFLTQLFTIFISSLLGAFIGSKIAVKSGDQLIKKAMVFVSIILIGKIVFFS